MIVAVGWLGPWPGSDSPSQATYTLGWCHTSMMCGQKCSQIFGRIWNSRSHKSEYQCSILQWGTVFTNDSRLVGSITKVWQPFTSSYTLGRCLPSMMSQKCSQIFVSADSEILTLTRVNTSAPSWNVALYSPMIVLVGLLGPLPRSDNPPQE